MIWEHIYWRIYDIIWEYICIKGYGCKWVDVFKFSLLITYCSSFVKLINLTFWLILII